ncbi:MAG TPA: DUF4845 domain-containing protein [Gammaproteobacteria bacterium]|nr:DUF4845 domain-containing protein [Gammaproteobacteria bacterium]
MRRLSGQRGLSFWGFLFVCAFIGFIALAVIRLFPLYMESFKVSTAIEAMANMTGVATKSGREIQTSLLRRFEIDDVDRFTEHNIKNHLAIKPNEDGKGRTLTMAYEARGPLLGNLDAVLKFDKSILIPGTGQGE